MRHGDAFLLGMFSLLDALIDCPLDEALREADLGPGITEALLGTGPGTGCARQKRHFPIASATGMNWAIGTRLTQFGAGLQESPATAAVGTLPTWNRRCGPNACCTTSTAKSRLGISTTRAVAHRPKQ